MATMRLRQHIESMARHNTHSLGAGMQQALEYAEMLGVPFAFSSNGDGFLMHDRTVKAGKVEKV